MAVINTTSTDLRPIYQNKPNMRFATTFISNKYRKFAVNGESLMDKSTGEIFTKRPEDGRVVSFFQNKKYMSDLMMDLRIMLANNSSFVYPESTDMDACYLSTDYDMMTVCNDNEVNIIDDNHILNPESKPINKISFNLSRKTNGFFCRLTSRDCDKSVIEWSTLQYNSICKNYVGTNADFVREKEKFTTIPKWENSNAVLNYTLHVDNNTPNGLTYELTDYVRINEESCITFPLNILPYMTNANSVTVTINWIHYDKLHFLKSHEAILSSIFENGFNKFVNSDNNIFIRYCNICCFVDNYNDILLLGNEFIIALLDVPYVRRYMIKIASISTEANMFLSPNRPSDDLWGANGMWAEQIRDVFKGGTTVDFECESNLKQIEMYLADNDNTDYVNLSKTMNQKDIYVR